MKENNIFYTAVNYLVPNFLTKFYVLLVYKIIYKTDIFLLSIPVMHLQFPAEKKTYIDLIRCDSDI